MKGQPNYSCSPPISANCQSVCCLKLVAAGTSFHCHLKLTAPDAPAKRLHQTLCALVDVCLCTIGANAEDCNEEEIGFDQVLKPARGQGHIVYVEYARVDVFAGFWPPEFC